MKSVYIDVLLTVNVFIDFILNYDLRFLVPRKRIASIPEPT